MSFTACIPAGAFGTIRSAHQTSTNASSLAAAAATLLATSRESRRDAAGLEAAAATQSSKLLALRAQMASSPNLTPTVNKVKIERDSLCLYSCQWAFYSSRGRGLTLWLHIFAQIARCGTMKWARG